MSSASLPLVKANKSSENRYICHLTVKIKPYKKIVILRGLDELFPACNCTVCSVRYVLVRVRPRFFDQVGHEAMYASSGNKHFFTKSCHRQTYQNYEQSRQKLVTILGN